jgi:hypothetical protein
MGAAVATGAEEEKGRALPVSSTARVTARRVEEVFVTEVAPPKTSGPGACLPQIAGPVGGCFPSCPDLKQAGWTRIFRNKSAHSTRSRAPPGAWLVKREKKRRSDGVRSSLGGDLVAPPTVDGVLVFTQ